MNECMDQIHRNTLNPRQISKRDLHEGDADNIRKQFWLITVQAAWLIKTVHVHPYPICVNLFHLVTALVLCQMILAESLWLQKRHIVNHMTNNHWSPILYGIYIGKEAKIRVLVYTVIWY